MLSLFLCLCTAAALCGSATAQNAVCNARICECGPIEAPCGCDNVGKCPCGCVCKCEDGRSPRQPFPACSCRDLQCQPCPRGSQTGEIQGSNNVAPGGFNPFVGSGPRAGGDGAGAGEGQAVFNPFGGAPQAFLPQGGQGAQAGSGGGQGDAGGAQIDSQSGNGQARGNAFGAGNVGSNGVGAPGVRGQQASQRGNGQGGGTFATFFGSGADGAENGSGLNRRRRPVNQGAAGFGGAQGQGPGSQGQGFGGARRGGAFGGPSLADQRFGGAAGGFGEASGARFQTAESGDNFMGSVLPACYDTATLTTLRGARCRCVATELTRVQMTCAEDEFCRVRPNGVTCDVDQGILIGGLDDFPDEADRNSTDPASPKS